MFKKKFIPNFNDIHIFLFLSSYNIVYYYSRSKGKKTFIKKSYKFTEAISQFGYYEN